MKYHDVIKVAGMRKEINDHLHTKHKKKKNTINLSFS
jgi:hypothetical protein